MIKKIEEIYKNLVENGFEYLDDVKELGKILHREASNGYQYNSIKINNFVVTNLIIDDVNIPSYLVTRVSNDGRYLGLVDTEQHNISAKLFKLVKKILQEDIPIKYTVKTLSNLGETVNTFNCSGKLRSLNLFPELDYSDDSPSQIRVFLDEDSFKFNLVIND